MSTIYVRFSKFLIGTLALKEIYSFDVFIVVRKLREFERKKIMFLPVNCLYHLKTIKAHLILLVAYATRTPAEVSHGFRFVLAFSHPCPIAAKQVPVDALFRMRNNYGF